MVIVIKTDNGEEKIINLEDISYSFKRDTGYGLIFGNSKQEMWITVKEFNQIVDAIAKGK